MLHADRKGLSAPGYKAKKALIGSPECPQGEGEVSPGNLYLFHRCLVAGLVVTFFLKLKFSIPETGMIVACSRMSGIRKTEEREN